MSFKKWISLSLILSQLGITSSMAAPVAGTGSSGPTAEFTLLENLLALQGQNLPSDSLQAQVTKMISQYAKIAPEAGQQQRLGQALVDLGIYTAAQAQSYVTDAQKRATQAISSSATEQQASQAMTSEVMQLASLHPAGAQFSAGDLVDSDEACWTGIGALAMGAIGLTMGASYYWDNPTCTTPTRTETGWDSSTDSYETVTVATGPTTCTRQNYYPHRQSAANYMIAGGILAAIGGLLVIMSNDTDDCSWASLGAIGL